MSFSVLSELHWILHIQWILIEIFKIVYISEKLNASYMARLVLGNVYNLIENSYLKIWYSKDKAKSEKIGIHSHIHFTQSCRRIRYSGEMSFLGTCKVKIELKE